MNSRRGFPPAPILRQKRPPKCPRAQPRQHDAGRSRGGSSALLIRNHNKGPPPAFGDLQRQSSASAKTPKSKNKYLW
ncbi:hypothetical protein NA56DRAFT_259045 [Hyaloscypha hepaticicola]|uniref:Uncharacterized protein n=1 Tax=Hyaloscypha hepaticicola TaxID=2082293 RepID=A0A2J6PVS9_9HELO|nr:hypothetical protein NA56DRAFT_259045 [Hyaloscypha hepaticicola]